MFILEFILLILDLITIFLLIKEIKINSFRFIRKIKPQNKILFYKLQKQYLNNCSNEDIGELLLFLNDYMLKRKEK